MNTNETLHTVIRYILKPASWIYGAVVGLRNWLFDKNILPQEEFDVPIITVGNLTVGGTGKTPHVEYIVSHLSMDYNMAVLSRGYKRKTKGFLLANGHSTPESVGDEPLQIYRKFGGVVKVAVCENRRKGILELLRLFPDLQLIVLDDGFQHRYVKPKVAIALMDYNRPIYEDTLLPLGRLRESAHQINRAEMIFVTKCPENLKPIDYRSVTNRIAPMPFQNLYFSTIRYGFIEPVFPDDRPYHTELSALTERDSVLLLTGVANPRGFVRHFHNYPFRVKVAHYPDHHSFTRDDIKKIEAEFMNMSGEKKIILTTEKDAVRLAYNPYYPAKLKQLTYYLPIEVKMLPGLSNPDFIADLKKAISS